MRMTPCLMSIMQSRLSPASVSTDMTQGKFLLAFDTLCIRRLDSGYREDTFAARHTRA